MNSDNQRPSISFLIYLWSILIVPLFLLARVASFLIPKLHAQLHNRFFLDLKMLDKARQKASKGLLFLCSSAGEYEQARPIIEAFSKPEQDCFVAVIFFSASGVRYIKARKDTCAYLLAPLDTVWHWKAVYKALRPNMSILVRHELWPACLAVSSRQSFLVGICLHQNPTEKTWQTKLKMLLLKPFQELHLVSARDLERFARALPQSKIIVSGDPKFDRAAQRAAKIQLDIIAPHNLSTLVLGSAWPADLKVLIASLELLRDEPWITKSRVLIVPHEVNPSMIGTLRQMIDRSLFPETFTILDQMGILAETYALADLALVGGAFEHIVHNVLEPAAYGIPVAFGPRHFPQPEAQQLIDAKLATMVQTPTELALWWKAHYHTPNARRLDAQKRFAQFLGAKDRIIDALKVRLGYCRVEVEHRTHV